MLKASLFLALSLVLVDVCVAAQNPLAKSPVVIKANACLTDLEAAGKKAGYETTRDNGEIDVLKETQAELLPLLVSAADCMDAAFPKREIVKDPKTGVAARVWYARVEGQYVWCSTNSLENTADQIDILRGTDPIPKWHALILSCAVGEKILGFYTPAE